LEECKSKKTRLENESKQGKEDVILAVMNMRPTEGYDNDLILVSSSRLAPVCISGESAYWMHN
jgi:hypothetical protein